MSPNLSHLITNWTSLTVLVIGDIMLDRYITGSSNRLCREAPVPVVAVSQTDDVPGGAANTAANVASLGGTVRLLSVVGQDLAAQQLQHCLNQRGVSTEWLVSCPERTTLAKQRVIAESQLLVRFDQGSTEAIAPDQEQMLIDRLVAHFPDCDAVIVSDYGYGILTPGVISTLADLQARFPRPLIVDSKQLEAYRQVGVTAVKPNYGEAIELLGLPKQTTDRAAQLAPCGDRLLHLTGAAMVALTLDTAGAILFEPGHPPVHTDAQPAPSHHATGAGDTFVSALALALATGASAPLAASLAAAATSIIVQQPGTTTCELADLHRALLHHSRFDTQLSRADLATCVQHYRTTGQRIVFTNGCFDILHPGHVTYLAEAKALGDVLIVGVNSDDSVRRLKGPDRPVNSLTDRLTVLSALASVDHVVPFSELTPHELIRIICPDIFVKGGDYRRDTLPEAELVESLGGEIVILPYVGDRSTTRLIQQIGQLQAEIGVHKAT
jgi:D-beta-D-heptose 7-phosphate kinase/D-beta-D-heptose 1-phosphate adenosyltransferase